MGSHDNVAGGHPRLIRDDTGRLPVNNPAIFEDMAPSAGNSLSQPGNIFGRVKLGLVLEAHRSEHVEWKISFADESGSKAESLGELHFLLDLADILLVACIDVGRFRLDVAVDPVLRGEALDRSDRGFLCLGIEAGPVLAECPLQGLVSRAVLGGYFGGRLTRNLSPDLECLDHGHGEAHVLERPCGRHPDNPAANNSDIDADVLSE